MTRTTSTAKLAVGAVAAAIVAVAVVILFTGGGGYTIHALFTDAGQLVDGGQVQVAGRTVGSIESLTVTPNGLADVTMSISDGGLTPLHQGTRAIIRAVGQAGVDNRFVEIEPGPENAPLLPPGSTLPTTQTTGIVDLDAVLDTFDPTTRAQLQQLIANSSQVFAGSGSRYFNSLLGRLDPALQALDGVSSQAAGDRAELTRLVAEGAVAAHAVASRSTDLEAAVANVAQTFTAVASQKAQLTDLLTRAPAVIKQATGTLTDVATAVTTLRPTLRALVPLEQPLERFLTLAPPTLDQATPVVTALTAELKPLRATLDGIEPLLKPALKALEATATAVRAVTPILVGVREYGSDLILGIFNGLGGLVSGPYTSQGHYAKLNFVQSPQTLFAGVGSELLTGNPFVPGLLAVRTGLTARCPGGDAPPAPDGSNPWIPSQDLCNPADDTPLSVDYP